MDVNMEIREHGQRCEHGQRREHTDRHVNMYVKMDRGKDIYSKRYINTVDIIIYKIISERIKNQNYAKIISGNMLILSQKMCILRGGFQVY